MCYRAGMRIFAVQKRGHLYRWQLHVHCVRGAVLVCVHKRLGRAGVHTQRRRVRVVPVRKRRDLR